MTDHGRETRTPEEIAADDDYELTNEEALVDLLREEIVFANGRQYICPFAGVKPETVVLFVLANDLFAWASADGEELPYSEIVPLHRAWKEHGHSGVTRWLCLRRKLRPLPSVERQMRATGKWDADLEALPLRGEDAR
jgi:hypothetical protein